MNKSANRRWKGQIRAFGWLGVAALLIAGPFNRAGLWEPFEFRFAELSRRLAYQLFDANVLFSADEVLKGVTQGQLPYGELPLTSSAFCFAWLGVSDFAGRLPSLVYGLVTAVTLWCLLGKFASKTAQLWGVLALATLPNFVWQSRMMLGDAATMGCLSLATVGLLFACFDTGPRWFKLFWALLGVLGLGAGVFCRGVLVGVFVPSMAVGIAAIRYWGTRQSSRQKRVLGMVVPVVCLGVGCLAFGVGGAELLRKEAGYSRWLGAVLKGPYSGGTFAETVTAVVHATFPWSSFLPAAAVWSVGSSRKNDDMTAQKSAVVTSLLLVVVLTVFALGLSSYRLVSMPFPAVFALAGLVGLSVERGQSAVRNVRLVAASVAAIAIVTAADFTNLPEKVFVAAWGSSQSSPNAFSLETRGYLFASLALVLLGCTIVSVGQPGAENRPFSRERIHAFFEQVKALSSGHFLSGLVLLETMLITTALMVHAHDRHFIYVPLFDSAVPGLGTGLKLLWLIPPLVLVIAPLGYCLVTEGSSYLLSKRWRFLRTWDGPSSFQSDLGEFERGAKARAAPWTALVVSLLLGSLCITFGHIPNLTERLSIKPALNRYERVSRSDEPLALLGMNAASARYYLKRTPKSFSDIGLGVQWLVETPNVRRFLVFQRQELAEVNAAFRAETQGKNLFLYAPSDGYLLLGHNLAGKVEPNQNPLASSLPATVPPLHQAVSGTFADAIEAVGWEFRDSRGQVLSALTARQKVVLRLAFRVIETPRADWQLFVHLDGKGQRQNADHEPVEGNYPTELWQPGDVVLDDHTFELEPGIGPGRFRLYFGFYRAKKRVDVSRGNHDDNRMNAGEFDVR